MDLMRVDVALDEVAVAIDENCNYRIHESAPEALAFAAAVNRKIMLSVEQVSKGGLSGEAARFPIDTWKKMAEEALAYAKQKQASDLRTADYGVSYEDHSCIRE